MTGRIFAMTGKMLAIMLLSVLIMPQQAIASYITNDFFVGTKSREFETTSENGRCRGTIFYPDLANDNELDLISKLNNAILEFAISYDVCQPVSMHNQSSRYKTLFQVTTGVQEFFSVKWFTKLGDRNVRIDAITLDKETAKTLDITAVLDELTTDVMPEIVRLSKKRLPQGLKWQEFIDKVHKHEVQFYAENSKWYLVFNNNQEALVVLLPKYLLKTQDTE